MSLFYSQGRGADVSGTLDFVATVLKHRAYEDGTRYYEGAEPFLFFLSRLLKSTVDAALHARLDDLFAARVTERIGAPGDALSIAMRIIACAQAGIPDEVDLRTLRMMQEEDGGWPSGWFYKYGSSGVRIGNRGLTTALAINALRLPAADWLLDTVPIKKTPRLTPISTTTSSMVPRGHRKRRSVREIAKDMRAYVFARPIILHVRKGSDSSSDEDSSSP